MIYIFIIVTLSSNMFTLRVILFISLDYMFKLYINIALRGKTSNIPLLV